VRNSLWRVRYCGVVGLSWVRGKLEYEFSTFVRMVANPYRVSVAKGFFPLPRGKEIHSKHPIPNKLTNLAVKFTICSFDKIGSCARCLYLGKSAPRDDVEQDTEVVAQIMHSRCSTRRSHGKNETNGGFLVPGHTPQSALGACLYLRQWVLTRQTDCGKASEAHLRRGRLAVHEPGGRRQRAGTFPAANIFCYSIRREKRWARG